MKPLQTLILPDGRHLAWEEAGDSEGMPILYCHGAPGSRLQRRVFMRARELHEAHVRMISPDRPGHGWSDFQPGRTIDQWPDDVAVLVDYLRLKHFAVLGFSGGTPYALAVAASRLPVSVIGLVSSDAPPGQVANVPAGLPDMAKRRPWLTGLMLQVVRLMAKVAPDFTADRGTAMLSEVDRKVVAAPRLRQRFLEMLRDAFRQGPQGGRLDLQLASRDWQVGPVPAGIPVHIWHGEADADSPLSIAHHLTDRLPQAHLHTFPGEGHVSVFVHHAGDIVRALGTAIQSPA
jgi:pimeloyl-ACP methyl ester carboxylesterase